eukprot:7198562-Alexandrium_andersonii.AAC.1
MACRIFPRFRTGGLDAGRFAVFIAENLSFEVLVTCGGCAQERVHAQHRTCWRSQDNNCQTQPDHHCKKEHSESSVGDISLLAPRVP